MILKKTFSITLTPEEKREIRDKLNKPHQEDYYSLYDHVEIQLMQAYCLGLEHGARGDALDVEL